MFTSNPNIKNSILVPYAKGCFFIIWFRVSGVTRDRPTVW